MEELARELEVDAGRVVLDNLNDVVEIPGARSLQERSSLFREQLLNRVRRDGEVVGQVVRVGMERGAVVCLIDQHLVLRQVEENVRQLCATERPTVGHLALKGRLVLLVVALDDLDVAEWVLDAAEFVRVLGYRLEHADQRVGCVHRGGTEAEVEVFRESVRLEVALLEARSALEDPVGFDLCVPGQCGQEPPEHVVLLDDVDAESPAASALEDVFLPNHEASFSGRVTLRRSPQRVRIFPVAFT